MKKLFIIVTFLVSNLFFAQEKTPKAIVEDFFIAFHAKDTVALRELCHPEIVLRTVANTKEGNKLKDEKFDEFLNDDSFWNTALFLGAGYRTQNLTIGVKYNVLHKDNNQVYSQAWLPFVRVMF